MQHVLFSHVGMIVKQTGPVAMVTEWWRGGKQRIEKKESGRAKNRKREEKEGGRFQWKAQLGSLEM